MSGKGGKALALAAVGAIGWYTGVKFWQPLIVEQLKKDNNLRADVDPEAFKDDDPKNWEELKQKVRTVLRPEPSDPLPPKVDPPQSSK